MILDYYYCVFIIIGITGCNCKTSMICPMRQYEIGLEVLKTTGNYLSGKIDEKETMRSINIT